MLQQYLLLYKLLVYIQVDIVTPFGSIKPKHSPKPMATIESAMTRYASGLDYNK